jgi:hypothetical protein
MFANPISTGVRRYEKQLHIMLRQLRDQRHADQTGQEIMFIGDSDDVAARITDNALLSFPLG